MSRNVLNIWAVERFLDALRNPGAAPEVNRWLDRVARRWIVKEFPVAGRVVRLRQPAAVSETLVDVEWPNHPNWAHSPCHETTYESPHPTWLEAALSKGVYWLDLEGPEARDLALELEDVLACFQELPNEKLSRVERISLPDALDLAARNRARNETTPDNTLMRFPGGYRIAVLGTAKELEQEGEQMSHCVGSYAGHLNDGTEILSLRDARGRPHVTMQVNEGRWLNQVKGKANGPVAAPYRPLVESLIDELGLTIRGDQDLVGITNRSFRADDPRSWRNRPQLAGEIRREIAELPCQHVDIDAFYGDLEATHENMDTEIWAWMIELFRGPNDTLVWPEPSSSFEIADEWFFVALVRFPFRLYWLLGSDARSRALESRILQDLDDLLVRFFKHDDRTLIAHRGSLEFMERERVHLCRTHKRRVLRRFLRAWRKLDRGSLRRRHSAKTLAMWEKNAEKFERRLSVDEITYL